MSFILNENGKTYHPGYFLAHEECRRETRTIPQSGATNAANGGKYVKMGTIFPANDATAIGIVYEDVDVTSGNMPGSVVTCGVVYEGRLPVELTEDTTEGGVTTLGSKSALEALGFVFVTEPTVTRPSDGSLS